MEPTAVKPEEGPAEELAKSAGMEPDERRLRICELLLVLGVAFLWPTIGSLIDWWTDTRIPDWDAIADTSLLVHAVVAISVLAYVLNRQGRDFRSIGLTARLSDIPLTLLLWFFAFVFRNVVGGFAHHLFPPKPGPSPISPLHDASIASWVAVLPAAAAEELIVRAFLISEVAEIWNSVPLAVFVSIGLQTLYHLYQGTPAALTAAGAFFVCSVFYASTRRITPVILVHVLHNVWVLSYAGH